MITLEIGINAVFVTLRERSELTNPDILVNVIPKNDRTNNKVVKTAITSDEADRVDEVEIELVANQVDEDLPNKKIFLQPGLHEYQMFESDDGTEDITGKKLLEAGILDFNQDKITTTYERTKSETVYRG